MSAKRDTSKKRDEILDAAIREFEAVGYDNTSMDRIAETAGVSKRTVYNHFASKEALFEAALNRLKGSVDRLKAIPYDPRRSLAEQLAEFIDAKRAVASNPAWLRMAKVVMAVFVAHPELARETMESLAEDEDQFVLWLKAATADGQLRVDDPHRVADIFWAMVSGAFFWPRLFLGPVDDAEVLALKKEMITLFLARYGIA